MPTPDGQFRLRCFRQTLSVSIFLLTFPWQAWTAAPPSVHSPPFIILDLGLRAHTTLRNGYRCHRHCNFWVCGLVPWHLRDPDQSTCVCRLYMA